MQHSEKKSERYRKMNEWPEAENRQCLTLCIADVARRELRKRLWQRRIITDAVTDILEWIVLLIPPYFRLSPLLSRIPPPLHTHTPNPTPHLHLVKNERSLSQTLLGNRLLQFIQLCCPNYLRRLFIINIIIFTSKRNYFRLRNKGIIKSNNEKGWKERKNLFSCNVKIVI